MNLSFVVLCMAATALVALVTSASVGLLLRPFDRTLDAVAPVAQARVWLLLALLPVLACAAVMAAALAPSLGWIADHCVVTGDAHDHPHICAHHVEGLPALSLLVLAAALAARVLGSAIGLARQGLLNVSTSRTLEQTVTFDAGRLRVLPLQAPHAFVLGVLRPRLYVTRGLLSDVHREHLDSVLAHERAHLRRADPLRMLIANAGVAFHLPGVAGLLRRRLLRAQEMAADFEAANVVGSRERVAQALVDLSRAQHGGRGVGFAFGACNVEARVEKLLDERPCNDAPARSTLALCVALALLVIGLHADGVHHTVEHVLGALSR